MSLLWASGNGSIQDEPGELERKFMEIGENSFVLGAMKMYEPAK